SHCNYFLSGVWFDGAPAIMEGQCFFTSLRRCPPISSSCLAVYQNNAAMESASTSSPITLHNQPSRNPRKHATEPRSLCNDSCRVSVIPEGCPGSRDWLSTDHGKTLFVALTVHASCVGLRSEHAGQIGTLRPASIVVARPLAARAVGRLGEDTSTVPVRPYWPISSGSL